jgi:hypothetical protein
MIIRIPTGMSQDGARSVKESAGAQRVGFNGGATTVVASGALMTR